MSEKLKESTLHHLDQTDCKILRKLQYDGRISNSQLAKDVNLSETPCWRRWKKLEESGYIKEYRTVLDHRVLGYGVVAFIQVSFLSHDVNLTDEFEKSIQRLEWVQSCHCITGNIDYLIQIIARDLDEFSERISYIRHIPGVHSIQSNLSVKNIKDTTNLPV
jgi:DNA-binding Lrp family transcriptional regulator